MHLKSKLTSKIRQEVESLYRKVTQNIHKTPLFQLVFKDFQLVKVVFKE